jgi:hypothetical protein
MLSTKSQIGAQLDRLLLVAVFLVREVYTWTPVASPAEEMPELSAEDCAVSTLIW